MAVSQIWIDGVAYEVDGSENLLHACLSLGFDLPYFCWHPTLGSVGACRQCAVKQLKDENDSRGRLVMACMTPAEDGTRISIADPEAREMRENVIEWLMTSHPHDCPVCDEGGECHLQDMTVMSGHEYRRYRFTKRTHRNQDLGPLVRHEMNRCIACYRCVRFYRDVAGGRDLDVFGAHDDVYFGRVEDGTLESEFAGNLVEVCPTGVFTDKTLARHYTRKWDLQSAPSLCVHCGVGCNVFAGERYGSVRRILNRFHHDVNGYFLCDRGRFGYAFVDAPERVRQPLVRRDGVLRPATWDEAVDRAAELLGRGELLGIGSPRASLESNHALRRLVGAESFHVGFADGEGELATLVLELLRSSPARSASLRDVEESDTVFLLGEDPTDTAPRLALALRRAARTQPLREAAGAGIPSWNDAALREIAQGRTGPFFVATPAATRFDELSENPVRGRPTSLARLAVAVAHALDRAAPDPAPSVEEAALARRIAEALLEAEQPLVVAGTATGDPGLLCAAADVARALARRRAEVGRAEVGGLSLILPECNSLGLAILGGSPLGRALEADNADRRVAVVVENDLYRRAPAAAVEAFLDAVPTIVVDHVLHETASRAEVVLPAATFAEGDGTLVSFEGRAQRFFQVFVPEAEIPESWRLLDRLAVTAGREAKTRWPSFADACRDVAASDPLLELVAELLPTAPIPGFRLPRQPHRYSGRTAMKAHRGVHEPQPPEDPDSPLAYSMEGLSAEHDPGLAAHYRAPGWNSVSGLNKLQREVGGPLRGGDPGRRLLEPSAGHADPAYFGVPGPRSVPEGFLLVLPQPEIFGGEELSSMAPAIAARSGPARLQLCDADAAALGLDDGDEVVLDVDGTEVRLPLRRRPELPSGLALVPTGRPEVPFLSLPALGVLKR